MNKLVASFCRVCGDDAQMSPARGGVPLEVHCPRRCGTYKLADTCATILGDPSRDNALLNSDIKKASVGHWLRQRQQGKQAPLLEADIAEQLAKDPVFPSLHDQREGLVRMVAEEAGGPGERIQFDGRAIQYRIGSRKPSAVLALVSQLIEDGLLTGQSTLLSHDNHQFNVALTFKGWLAYEEIHRGKTAGRVAAVFMAPGDPALETVWLPRLHSAVLEIGFGLSRIDAEPKPGVIDVRMRLQVRRARFLIVELTGAGPGAAWLAGFAAGLGKPVIYTRQEGHDIPIDPDHALRIVWNPARLEEALGRIQATIKDALPEVA